MKCAELETHCLVFAGSVEENSSIFANLSVLNMNNTMITAWNDLDKLSAIKSVSDIRLVHIPLVEVRILLLSPFSVCVPNQNSVFV